MAPCSRSLFQITLSVLMESSVNVGGVRLSLVGSGLSSVAATVTTTGKIRLLGGANTVTVMNSLVDELTDDGIDVADKGLTLVRHTGENDDPDSAR